MISQDHGVVIQQHNEFAGGRADAYVGGYGVTKRLAMPEQLERIPLIEIAGFGRRAIGHYYYLDLGRRMFPV